MTKKLKKNGDSRRVTEKTKRQLFVNAIGICAEPKCNSRVMENRTTLAECAHIIPNKEDSHPRGNEEISDEDRHKEPNLIYLCEKHHKIIDNVELAEFYPADTLRKWKKDHESWASGITKVSSYLSKDVRDAFALLEEKFAEQAHVPEKFIRKLLSICHDFLNKNLTKEAQAFLSQIDILLLGADNAELNAEADLLSAMLSASNEQISEAKEQLLKIIRAHPSYIEPMLEYIELCGSASEPTDELEQVEKLASAIDANHPHLLLINLSRQYQKQEPIKDESIFDVETDDIRLAARLICQHSMFCDMAGKTEQRDDLVEQWQKAMPNSPNPYRFKAMYKMMDVIRNSPEQTDLIDEALEFSKQQRQEIEDKDPLTPHGQIEWLLNELKLRVALFRISGEDTGVEAIRNDMILLISKCYFNSSINAMTADLLAHLPVEPDQWRIIVGRIQASNVAPSKDLIQTLFLHALRYDELSDDLENFVKKYDGKDLLQLACALKDNDAQKAAELVNVKKDSHFSLMLLQSIAHYGIASALADLLEIEPDYQDNFTSLRLNILAMKGQDDSAFDLITEDTIDQATLFALPVIEELLYKKEQWYLYIRAALRLLTLQIPDGDKTKLHGRLAMVYLKQDDATNAIAHAEQALSQPEPLGEYSSNILGVLGQALLNKGRADEACNKFAHYKHIKRAFGLLLLEADCYIKSNLDDKYNKALSRIVQAFEDVEVYEDKFYFPAFMLLVELSNAGVIPMENEPAIKDGLFVKLEDFSNWFYVGEEAKSLDAECIEPNTPNYKAVINKSLGDEISWPADKFSGHKGKRKILQIASVPSFLNQRAHEVTGNAAQRGDKGMQTIRVMDEYGTSDINNLKKFIEEQDQPRKKFFETYISNGLPFAFLCKMQGSLASALGILSSEERGFIQCNNRTQADIEEQKAIANKVLGGAPCFIEGLVAVMLAESGLIEDVVKALPNLGVSTSVIGLLRDIAGNFEVTAGKGGRGDFVKGKFQFREIDKAKDGVIRNKLLAAADLLDGLPGKVVGKTYPKSDKNVNLNNTMPNYFVDAFRYAQDKTAYVLTDDSLFVHAYKVAGETQIPQNFSSISLIRAMADNGQIDLQRYYQYFALLSSYRYHFLPLSVDDMIRAVLPTVGGGLVAPEPQNIYLLNLPLTLSQDYGVEAKTATDVLKSFFTALILNGSVTPQIADEIFTLTLAQALEKRDKKLMVKALRQGCHQNMLNQPWINPISKQKLETLDKQLFRIATLGAQHSLIIP